MLAVLNKRWLSLGWRVMDPKDSEPMALAWIEALNREAVPYQHYQELYQRSVELRARRLLAGLKCDDFSVEMMIACWYSLRDEIKQKEIDAGRTLTENAAAACGKCGGTNWKEVEENGYRGRTRCDHT